MTQPIQEPSTARTTSGLDWGQSQLARRPPPVNPGGDVAWLALADDGCNENLDGSATDVIFDQGYVSDNATGIFDLSSTLQTTTGCGANTPVFSGKILVDGIYTFAMQIEGEFDVTQSTPPQAFTMRTCIQPFTDMGTDAVFPGEFFDGLCFPADDHLFIPLGAMTTDPSTLLLSTSSRTTPLYVPAVSTPGPIEVGYNYSPAFDQFFTFQLWVTYHGPINYTGSFDFA